jgi:hypothetical protein
MMTTIEDLDDFKALEPFFRIIEPYANRYISVLTISDRKVSRWRDYLDPVAVFDAVGWPSH